MNILFCTVPFRPSIGGIETVSSILAEQFTQRGHAITLVTQTPGDGADAGPYPIVRRPDAARLWALTRDADVVFHNNISLRLAWPLLALRKPWVVAHHTWTPRSGAGHLKHRVLPAAENIAVSHAVAASIDVPSVVLPNPYRPDLFRRIEGIERTRDVIFVGRLVSDKGAALLLQALHRLRRRGMPLTATIVGDGPELPRLRALAAERRLDDLVHFAGPHRAEDVARLLNAHRYLAVPSVWEEPFGLVVLEALACGCVPVVARSGGLPDAAGACGVSFAKGDSDALATALGALHRSPAHRAKLLAQAPRHLARHTPERVAESYLRVLFDACRRHRTAFAA